MPVDLVNSWQPPHSQWPCLSSHFSCPLSWLHPCPCHHPELLQFWNHQLRHLTRCPHPFILQTRSVTPNILVFNLTVTQFRDTMSQVSPQKANSQREFSVQDVHEEVPLGLKHTYRKEVKEAELGRSGDARWQLWSIPQGSSEATMALKCFSELGQGSQAFIRPVSVSHWKWATGEGVWLWVRQLALCSYEAIPERPGRTAEGSMWQHSQQMRQKSFTERWSGLHITTQVCVCEECVSYLSLLASFLFSLFPQLSLYTVFLSLQLYSNPCCIAFLCSLSGQNLQP